MRKSESRDPCEADVVQSVRGFDNPRFVTHSGGANEQRVRIIGRVARKSVVDIEINSNKRTLFERSLPPDQDRFKKSRRSRAVWASGSSGASSRKRSR